MINTLYAMVFLHVVDDYVLQGILAQMKQKSWWTSQLINLAPWERKKYENDYLMALAMHSFSWAFMISLPFFFHHLFPFILPVNMIIHMIVDDAKANKKKINLVQDQTIHLIQILVTFILFTIY